MNVSKLTKVKIKDIWKTEDRDFTPWLVENITRLNEDIGFNIQDPQKENRLENFPALAEWYDQQTSQQENPLW